ncbi:MAG: transposase family protein, partial [Bacillota bacterium]|nr:transposase family protein [Bacillota bacterium]
MLYNDYYIENLLGFKDIILKNVKNFDDEIHLYVEMKVKEHNCPSCNSLTKNIHDYRMQPIKDIPMFGKSAYLNYRKRRYVCKRCGKKFYEKSSFSPRYHRMSLRLVKYIVHQMRKCHSIKSIANECNVTT